jgi:hypothetical protein
VDMDRRIVYVTCAPSKKRAINAPPPSPPAVTDRRGAVRVCLPKGSPAQLQLQDATLLNISSSGALIEHPQPAWRGGIYCLSFPAEGLQVRLLVRAIHASARQRVAGPGGEGEAVFRTGMEFIGIGQNIAKRISAFIDHARQRNWPE